MKIHQTTLQYDLESEIVKNGNVPSPVPLVPWQERIDKIVGKTLEGRSRLRIVWGQSFEATQWLFGKRRMKYPFWRTEEEGEIHDIGTPRFYVEELHDLEELRKDDGWEKARYQWEGMNRIDVLGDVPLEGVYTSVFMIAHHDHFCCDGALHVKGQICLGAYRPPADADLTRIRRMKQQRDAATPTENKPSAELIEKWNEEAKVRRDERRRSNIRDAVQSWVAVHGHRLTDSMNPKILHSGGRHFTPTTQFKEITDDRTSDSNSSAAA